MNNRTTSIILPFDGIVNIWNNQTEVLLNKEAADWFLSEKMYDSSVDNLERFGALTRFKDWHTLPGNLAEFVFNDSTAADEFRLKFTDWKIMLEHRVYVAFADGTRRPSTDIPFLDKISQIDEWLEAHCDSPADYYCELCGHGPYHSDYVYFFKNPSTASLFKLTFG